MSILFAIPDTEESSELHWFQTLGDGRIGSVEQAELNRSMADQTVLVVSGRDVFTGKVDVVTRSEKQLREVALFQLEDDLASPVAGLHLALGPAVTNQENSRFVNIVLKQKIEIWLSVLKSALGTKSTQVRIVSDTSLLLGKSCVFDGDGVVLAAFNDNVAAIDSPLASEIFPALMQSWEMTDFDYVHTGRSALEAELTHGAIVQTQASYPEFLGNLLQQGSGIDLRQAGYKTSEKVDLGFVGKWTGTFALAAAAAIVWIAYIGLGSFQISSAADRLYQQSIDSYSAAFPDEGRVANPAARIAEKLRNANISTKNVSAMALLSGFYTALSRTDGIELLSVTYNETSGQMTSSLKFSSYQDRDQLKQSMESAGLSIELGGVAQEDGFLVGQAVIGVGK